MGEVERLATVLQREAENRIEGGQLSAGDCEDLVRAILAALTKHHGPDCECEPCAILQEGDAP